MNELEMLSQWCNSVKLYNNVEPIPDQDDGLCDYELFWTCEIGNIEVKDKDINAAIRGCNKLAMEDQRKYLESIRAEFL